MQLTHSVYTYIVENKLLDRGDHVLIGVSGGADSITLLYVLNELRHRLGITLSIAHYNHQLRKSARLDQEFVDEIAQQLHIPFYTEKWIHRKKIQGSIEAKAREKRLTFFTKTLKKSGANKVALAHTEDDQAETVLMRLMRGTGLKGLCAIQPLTKLDNVTVIRPLLFLSKKDLLTFLKLKKYSFREDPTNSSSKFTRNKIRHELLPLLAKDYNPNIISVLAALAQTVSDDYECLDQITTSLMPVLSNAKTIRFNLSVIRKQPPALAKMMLRQGISKLKGDTRTLTHQHLLEILSMMKSRQLSTEVHLPHHLVVKKTATQLIIYKRN